MDGDKRSPSKGFKSFLRGGRALPGKVKLTRAEIAGANASQDFSRMTSSMGVTNSTSQESDSTATDFEPRKAPENEGMHGMPSSGTNLQAYQQSGNLRSMSNTRQAKFKKLLDSKVYFCDRQSWLLLLILYQGAVMELHPNVVVDLDALYELSWSGIPHDLRPICWQLLLGYLPPNRDRREQVLARKRQEYADQVKEHFEIGISERSEEENAALRQVSVDVPRTAPGVAFFHQEPVQKSLERILYLWGIRHPASGYVQGINDLVTPFLTVFLSEHFEGPMEFWSVESLSETTVTAVEADSYWCLSRLLEGIQDHYTHAQPGIQRMVFSFQELVRWVNCLLLREVPFLASLRLWDTYLAEGPRLKEFLKYVLAAFLLSWSQQLANMDFQAMVLFLQRLPTKGWTEKEIEMILSKAFMWRATFNDAQSHLTQH